MSTEVFIPEFIPFYIAEVEKFKLSTTEGLVYGFCRFYKKNNKHFYFTSDQLSKIIGCSVGTVDNCFSELSKKGLLETKKVGKGGGGTVRFVNKVLTADSDDLTKGGGDDLTKGGDSIKENNILEYNNINNINIINDSDSIESPSLQENEIEPLVEESKSIDSIITRNAEELEREKNKENIRLDILGYERLYQINLLGDVRNDKLLILTPTISDKGYKRVELRKDGIRKRFRIHRLLYSSYHKRNISPEEMVLHIDDNQSNNDIDNLILGDHNLNMIHKNKNREIKSLIPSTPPRKRGDTGVNDVIKIVQDKCKDLGIVYQKGKNERARAKNFTQKTKTEQIQDAGFNCFSDYVDFVFDKQNKFKIGKTINSVEMLYYKGNDVINQYNLNFKNLDNLKFEIHDWAKIIAENPEKYGSNLYHNVCKYSTRLGRGLLEGWILLDVEKSIEEIRKDYVITNFDLIVAMEEHYNYYINKSYKEGNYISSLRKWIFNNLKRSAGN